MSRALANVVATDLPKRTHETFITTNIGGHITGQISTESAMIEARERPVKIAAPKRKRGWARKGEKRPRQNQSSCIGGVR